MAIDNFKPRQCDELIDYNGLVRVRWRPAEGRCCNQLLVLSDFTNTCHKCGKDYDRNGWALAPRSQWGEETGEHWSECY